MQLVQVGRVDRDVGLRERWQSAASFEPFALRGPHITIALFDFSFIVSSVMISGNERSLVMFDVEVLEEDIYGSHRLKGQ